MLFIFFNGYYIRFEDVLSYLYWFLWWNNIPQGNLLFSLKPSLGGSFFVLELSGNYGAFLTFLSYDYIMVDFVMCWKSSVKKFGHLAQL